MTDIATIWDPVAGLGDWSLVGADLGAEQGLRTAAVLSLLSDATLNADDELPPDGNRGGWWGDLVLDGDRRGDRFGSRLRLLRRAKATEETRRRAVLIAREALAWMVADGVAASIDVAAEFAGDRREQLRLLVGITRPGSGHVERFDFLWNFEGTR